MGTGRMLRHLRRLQRPSRLQWRPQLHCQIHPKSLRTSAVLRRADEGPLQCLGLWALDTSWEVWHSQAWFWAMMNDPVPSSPHVRLSQYPLGPSVQTLQFFFIHISIKYLGMGVDGIAAIMKTEPTRRESQLSLKKTKLLSISLI